MASALASPPPPLPFGASDLKRNARTFLERALVISAIVHLAAVGAFRAAYERSLAREGDDSKRITGVVDLIPDFIPPMIPVDLIHPKSAPPDDGLIVPVKNVEKPFVDFKTPGITYTPEELAGPPGRDGGREQKGRNPGAPREEASPAILTVDKVPVPRVAPKPPYPDWAREARIEGTVVLRVLVGADGIPKQVVIVRGPKGLTDEAAKAVARWKFDPGMVGRDAVEVWVEVPVVFTLQ